MGDSVTGQSVPKLAFGGPQGFVIATAQAVLEGKYHKDLPSELVDRVRGHHDQTGGAASCETLGLKSHYQGLLEQAGLDKATIKSELSRISWRRSLRQHNRKK